MQRRLPFEGIDNFRDFGGYATADGGRLISGRLFRSAHHAMATEADLQRLAALGVTAIVDLRLPDERTLEPSRRWPRFAGEVVECDLPTHAPEWMDRLRGGPLTPEWLRADACASYRRNPFEPRHVDLFGRFLRAAAETEGALVIHCAGGKDRTGIACALLHSLAGVHHDDIVADYLLTNDEAKIAVRMENVGAWLEGELGRRPSDDALQVVCSAFPEYLDAAFAGMTDACGSVQGYVEQVLGLDRTLRARLRARVLS